MASTYASPLPGTSVMSTAMEKVADIVGAATAVSVRVPLKQYDPLACRCTAPSCIVAKAR